MTVRLLRAAAGLAVAALVGFWLLAVHMSDLGPGETSTDRLAWAVALAGGGGLAVGLVAGRAWPLAALCAWPLLLRALVDLWRLATGGGGGGLVGEAAVPGLAMAALALAAGWLGGRLTGGASRA